MQGKSLVIIFRVSIFSVANDWMAEVGKMDANLIFLSGKECEFEQAEIGGLFENSVSGFCEFAFFRIGCGINDEGFVLGEV